MLHLLLFFSSYSLVLSLTTVEKGEIVKLHNKFRANVIPTASNMFKMSYYSPAEKTAQAWANKCIRLQHQPAADRADSKYGYCGQNIFISLPTKLTWTKAVTAWHNEVADFVYGSEQNIFNKVGHYTQVVWAATHKVGCGYKKCTDAKGVFHNYVCNYCPGGNIVGQINTPYKEGAKCSACPNSCENGNLCLPPK